MTNFHPCQIPAAHLARIHTISSRIAIIGGGSRTGQAFHRLAQRRGLPVRTLVRTETAAFGPETIVVDDYFDPPDHVFAGIGTTINFAGITHGNDAALLDAVNAVGPVRLAEKAKACGVRHFIHLSSFMVYGGIREITRHTAELPDTLYGHSKLRADKELRVLADDDFTVTILRLPMLYGRGAGDNLKRIGTLIARLGLFPIPRRTVRRSVLHVDNLAVILAALTQTPVSGTLIVADKEPFTHAALVDALAIATGRRPRLVALPDAAFAILRVALPGLYNKVYESKFAHPSECAVPLEPLPVSLRDGLIEFFASKGFA